MSKFMNTCGRAICLICLMAIMVFTISLTVAGCSTVPSASADVSNTDFASDYYAEEKAVIDYLVNNSVHIWSITPTEDGYTVTKTDGTEVNFDCPNARMAAKQLMKNAVFIEDMWLNDTPVQKVEYCSDCIKYHTGEYGTPYIFRNWEIDYQVRYHQYSDALFIGRHMLSTETPNHIRIITEYDAIPYVETMDGVHVILFDEDTLIQKLSCEELVEAEHILVAMGRPHEKISKQIKSLS